MINIHNIKCESRYFSQIYLNLKNFEIRLFDRPYKENDIVILNDTISDSYIIVKIKKIIIEPNTFEGLTKDYGVFTFDILDRKNLRG